VDQSTIPSLVEKIMSSPQYHALLQAELNLAKQTVSEYINQHHDQLESPYPVADHDRAETGSSTRLRQHSSTFSNTSNPNSESSYGSFSFHMSPGYEDVKSIVGNITSPDLDTEIRLLSIKKYSAFSSADLISIDLWPTTKGMLAIALGDPNEEIALVCLQLLARIFRSSPPNVFIHVTYFIADW
jgi:hypothetical protein